MVEKYAVKSESDAESEPAIDQNTLVRASDAQPLLMIDKLQLSWPEQRAPLLNIRSLTWYRGCHIWLQGANGCGKTTLMRLLSGLEPVTHGRIEFVAVSGRPVQVCYLHQTPYLFAGTVQHNLNFVIRSLKRSARAAALNELKPGLKLAGLEALRRQNAVTLSGGERQRLALLRAWLLQPDVLLLDEPAANLDDGSVILMQRLLSDLVAKGCSVMISSHQNNSLTDFCDTRWVIQGGSVRVQR